MNNNLNGEFFNTHEKLECNINGDCLEPLYNELLILGNNSGITIDGHASKLKDDVVVNDFQIQKPHIMGKVKFENEIEAKKLTIIEDENNSAKNVTLNAFKVAAPGEVKPLYQEGKEYTMDILRNGQLIKKIISKGLGQETRPIYGDSVTVEYKAWNEKGELFLDEECSFVIGEGDMIRAFDLAVCQAERQEVFELLTDSEYAYGAHGWHRVVRPHEKLKFHIKIVSVDDPPDYLTYTREQRIEAAQRKSERGKFYYLRDELSYAVNSYSLAIKILESDPMLKRDCIQFSDNQMSALYFQVISNLAVCQLELEHHDDVIESCDTILRHHPDDLKALIRKGKSLYATRRYLEALVVLLRALHLDRSDRSIHKMIGQCRECILRDRKEAPDKETRFWTERRFKYWPHLGAVMVIGLAVVLARFVVMR